MDHRGGIEVVGNQSYRLEAVHEVSSGASPSLIATALLQGSAAALGQVGKPKARDLLEPGRESRGRTFPNPNDGNARVEHVKQLRLRQVPSEMRRGDKARGATAEHCDPHSATSIRVSAGRSRCCTARTACATSGREGAWS